VGKNSNIAEQLDTKKKCVRLTERDLQMIRWINGHRVATAEQVASKFGLSAPTAKKRLQGLKSLDYLVYEKVFQGKPGIYRAAARGIAVTEDSLPVARLVLGSYEHDLQLVDLAVSLEHRTGAQWQTDREIRHEKGLKGVGTFGHSPDGVLLFPGGARIAVELELSPKGAGKIEKIFMEYAGSQYQEVWYFVNCDYLAARIRSAALPLIKVFSWPDLEEYKEIPRPSAAKPLLESAAFEDELKTVRDFFHRRGREAGV
jgi:hypothetical protein